MARPPHTSSAAALVMLLLAVPVSAQAQEPDFPYTLSNQDWALAAAGVATSLLGAYAVDGVEPISLTEIRALDRQAVNGFDRNTTNNWSPTWQDRSDWPRDILVVSSALVAGIPGLLGGEWGEVATLGTIFLEAAAFTTGATYAAKGMAGRTRPCAYNPSLTPEERLAIAGSGSSVHLSFFSGHTSAAFAAATLMSTIYTDLHGFSTASKILWGSSLSLATVTAYARVKGGMHFPSDVIVGAVVGSAIGYLVPALHRKRSDDGIRISAGPGGLQMSLAVGGR